MVTFWQHEYCDPVLTIFVGTPTLRMNEYILSNVAQGSYDKGSPDVRPSLPAPEELKFQLDETSYKYIAEAEKHYDELIGAHDLHVRCTSTLRI
jgi:carnitine O-acetyltransferase